MRENLSLSPCYSQTKKESAEKERDGEKAVSAAAECLYIFSLLFSLSLHSTKGGEQKRKKSLVIETCESDFLRQTCSDVTF